MRLRSYLVGLAVIASSTIGVNPVEARCRSNGWCEAGCSVSGECVWLKKVGGRWPLIQYKFQTRDLQGREPYPYIFTSQVDCNRGWSRSLDPIGPWRDVLPGTKGETMLEMVCR